jgi:hypothetical protein
MSRDSRNYILIPFLFPFTGSSGDVKVSSLAYLDSDLAYSAKTFHFLEL